jgi:chromosome partitioning protein
MLEIVDEVRSNNPDLEIKLLINRKIPGTRVGRDAREAMEVFKLDVLDTELCQRVAFIDSLTSGVSVMQYAPRSKAAEEIESLREEITSQATIEESQTHVQSEFEAPPEERVENPMWLHTHRE